MKRKMNVYCWHTSPRSFKEIHFENSEEEKLEFFGHKITDKFLLFVFGSVVNTFCMIICIVNPISKMFGKPLIEEVKNDLRCEVCKKESAKQ